MGLADELRADVQRPTRCHLCRWLVGQSQTARSEWAAVLDDRSFSHRSIHRALERRQATVPLSSVERHRLSHHKP